jgi:molybdopterin-guanine dinucleotide biosynthesis protein B
MTSNSININVPLIGFVGPSGSGKTTLLSRVIPLLRLMGLRIAIIKHTHHDFDIDKPGKDSYELRKAGAAQTLLASPRRTALVIEHGPPFEEVRLQDCLSRLNLDTIDLILVEGFKHEAYPKIELQRLAFYQPPLHREDSNIIAVATNDESPAQCRLPMLDINNPQQVCDFIIEYINHHGRQSQKTT